MVVVKLFEIFNEIVNPLCVKKLETHKYGPRNSGDQPYLPNNLRWFCVVNRL
jgi:hypothetical protein